MTNNIVIIDYSSGRYDDAMAFLKSMEPWKTDVTDDHYFKDVFENGKNQTKLAMHDGEIVGVVVWMEIEHFPYGGYVRALAIAEKFQRQSLGTRLLKAAEDATFSKLKNMYVVAYETEMHARRFYEKCGYEEVGPMHDFAMPGVTLILFRKTTGAVWG